MTIAALNTPKEYALCYHGMGFAVFVLKNEPAAYRKRPAVKWELYQIMRSSKIQIERWFTKNPNYNIAVATGGISKIVALDVDEEKGKKRIEEKRMEMSTNLRVALDNTMLNKTGSGGWHIIFRMDEPIEIGSKVLWRDSQDTEAEIRLKANGGYIVMPPSIHKSENRYQWNGKEPDLITRQELNELIRLLGSPRHMRDESEPVRFRTSTNLWTEEGRTLTDDKMKELLYWIKPYYNTGSRNDIVFYLSGMMRIGDFTQETARAFVTILCNTSGYPDEDLAKSLDVVDNTYEKPIEQVKGKSGLHELLIISHTDADDTNDYLARGEAYARICQITNPLPPPTPPLETTKEASLSLDSPLPQQQIGETDAETKVRGLTETLERRYHFAAMEDTDELFYYNEEKGLYEPAQSLVKAQVEKQYLGVITSTVTNVIEKLVRRHLHKRDEFDADIYILNLENGLYDIRTNTLREHTWEYLSRKRIPIKYDPQARTKKFGKFLSEVNYPNQIRTTVEAMAYTFLRDNPFELYFILLGFGSNGKTVLMHVLTKLHGEDNVAHTSLVHLLGNRFSKIELEGKNVNIDMEMSRATIDDMSVLKELTGSEPIRIEPKYQPAYVTRLWAKHFFSANKMPAMVDDTDAHYRREVIISFPNQFVEGVNDNPDLKYELATDEELSGIFNVLMKPLRRIALEHKPPYKDAKTIQERKLKHQLTAEPIKTFLEFATEPKDYESDPDIRKEDLYEGYKKFCAFYKIPWQKYQAFCDAVKRSGVKDDRETWGERKRVWVGIRLKKSLFEDTLTA